MKHILLIALALVASTAFADTQNPFPQKGSTHPQVTIIEFTDFQCPFCNRSVSTMNDLLAAYGDQLALVHRNFPLGFHVEAKPAAVAAYCAQAQGKFWEMHDLLFKNQAQLGSNLYLSLAGELGLDVSDFGDCLESSEAKSAVALDIADAEMLQLNSTPSFLMVSRSRVTRVSGALPYAEFKKRIDDLIANP